MTNSKTLVIGFVPAILIYIISFGPMMFCVFKFDMSFGNVVSIVYKPHTSMMYYNETYYQYCSWWMELGNNRSRIVPWVVYKDAVDKAEIQKIQ